MLPNTASRLKAKQAALNQIFTQPLTRDAMAAIKRTGITVQWTYPLVRKNTGTNSAERSCAIDTGLVCNTYVMIGKVNATTSYVVNMIIKYGIDGSWKVELRHAYVLQTRKMSSSRTIVSAADLNNKTAIWVDANVSTGGLRTVSANSSTVRLTARVCLTD